MLLQYLLRQAGMQELIEKFESMSEPLKTSIKLPRTGAASFSLLCVFQIVTACCIFFACLKISPLLAIVGTLISTPAIIRTGIASEIHRRKGICFRWGSRLKYFGTSVLVVLLTSFVSFAVFTLISMAFGLFCVGVALLVGQTDLLSDIAFIGMGGGMIWGVAGGIVSVCYCARKTWMPQV